MSITASLAFSQLKKKRGRSLAAVLAIILSTSLTTAVCSLMASVNATLTNLLGKDYGDYGGAYLPLLLVPGILFGILIVTMSVIVISNVFRVSAGERMAQFGTLKCVGATEKQITQTVMYESLFLSLAGIPCGILLGIGFTYLGAGAANYFLDDLNSLVHMMLKQITFSVAVVISWKALLMSGIISFLTVLLSAWLPAKKAARISAIDCIRNNEAVSLPEEMSKRHLNRHGVIERELAAINVRRNRKNTKASVTVLSISIILFIGLSGLKEIAESVERYMYPDTAQTVIVDYTSSYENTENRETGRWEQHYNQPINTEMAERITEELTAYDNNHDFFGCGQDYATYVVTLKEDDLTADMIAAQEYIQETDDISLEFPVEIIIVDSLNYRKICEKAGAQPGANILLNDFFYNHRGTEEHLAPFSGSLQTLTLERADGTSELLNIDAMLTREDIPRELFYPNTNPVRLVVPQAQVRGFSWTSAPVDETGYMKYANEVLERYFPEGGTNGYDTLGYHVRVYKMKDYVKVMNIAIMLAAVFLYSFVVLLALIGIINVISTMTTNIQMREREFAVLQSIGMTSGSLRKMLNIESALCAGKALLFGLPIGLALIFIMNCSIRTLLPVPFCIPWGEIAAVIVFVFFLVWSTIRMGARKLKSQNVIETIRRADCM